MRLNRYEVEFIAKAAYIAAMRILSALVVSLFVSASIFFTIKFWGLSQVYAPYAHPFYNENTPVMFSKPVFSQIREVITNTQQNLYLDVAFTADQKVVLIQQKSQTQTDHTKNVRSKMYDEIKNDVYLLQNFKDFLKNRKIIFNITENAIAGHLIFVDELKKLELDKGTQTLITSPYETMAQSIKDILPAHLYATTQPEILKIKAMESLKLIEATSFRADVVIYPLTFYKQVFFTNDLINELNRRHKKIIIGPINTAELEKASSLKPFGIVIDQNL